MPQVRNMGLSEISKVESKRSLRSYHDGGGRRTLGQRDDFAYPHDGKDRRVRANDKGNAMRRRDWLRAIGAGFVPLFGCRGNQFADDTGETAEPLVRFPGKVPLRVVNDSPPCLETPWKYYREDFTPNNAFYVRWHLRAIPTEVDPETWRLKIDGHVNAKRDYSHKDLKSFEQVTIAAVNQCSGNSLRVVFAAGSRAQWNNGAVGNAPFGPASD